MNFFEAQAQHRASTRRLVLLFVLAILAIVGAIAAVIVIAAFWGSEGAVTPGELGGVLAWTSGITVGIIVVASLVKTARLRSGGAAVAKAMGAVPLPAASGDFRYRRARNVIEEMAIASGVPVPQIFVLENEPAINAFAAGYTPADAAIAVTRGALDKLTRDELQGVIAHEYSHVLNGDMRLNIRLMGVIFGVLVIHIIAREVLARSGRGSSKKDGGAIILVALAIMVIGYIGVVFGRMIKASVSRSRELLADASAVQFTRQSSGLAGALKKLAGLAAGSKLAAAHTEEVSHMLFGDGVGYSSLFATHPPLVDRIRALEPGFRPGQLAEPARTWNAPGWIAEDLATAPVSMLGGAPRQIDAATLVRQVGAPGEDAVRQAELIHAHIPAGLLDAAHDPVGAAALTVALLLDADAAVRERQLALIEPVLGAGARERVLDCAREFPAAITSLRLPLATLAFPALRRRPAAELAALMRLVGQLIQADGRIGAFEYCLGRLLRLLVADARRPSRAQPHGALKLDACAGELQVLLGVLACHGHADERTARPAYLLGFHHVLPKTALPYAPPAEWTRALDAALARLDQLAPMGKQVLVEGLVLTMGHDGRITIAEAELLRVVCAALHVPLPAQLGAPG